MWEYTCHIMVCQLNRFFSLFFILCWKPCQEKKKTPRVKTPLSSWRFKYSALSTGEDFLTTDRTFLCWTGHHLCSIWALQVSYFTVQEKGFLAHCLFQTSLSLPHRWRLGNKKSLYICYIFLLPYKCSPSAKTASALNVREKLWLTGINMHITSNTWFLSTNIHSMSVEMVKKTTLSKTDVPFCFLN